MIEDVVKALAEPLEPIDTGVSPRIESLGGIRAVMFDVYGTLLISGSGDIGTAAADNKEECFVAALRAAGQTYSGEASEGLASFHNAIAAVHESLKKKGTAYPEVRIDEVWQKVITKWDETGRTQEPFDADRARLLAIEYEMRVNPVWPMPGLVDVLDTIRKAGLTLGVVSNAQAFTPKLFEPLTGRSVSSLGFVDELCFWSYEHRHAKPGVALYEEAAEVLAACGLEVEQVLYVGNDMRNDIWPASKVGFRTALFAGDGRSLRLREGDEEVAGVEPTVVITDLAQLLTVLGITAQ